MPVMLSSRELREARSDVLETLTDTCEIQRATESVSSAGIVSQTWAAIKDEALCRIDPETRRDNQGVIAGREASRARFQATFEWDEDIIEGDRVIYEGETLELIELHGIHSARIVTRAVLAKIEGA